MGNIVCVYVFEHADPDGGYASGIDNVIYGMIDYPNTTKWILVGVTSNPKLKLGQTVQHPKIKSAQFIPVARLNKQQSFLNKKIPDSFRYSFGLLRFRTRINPTLIHAHRIEIGFIATLFWRKSILIQFIHNAKHNLINSKSDSKWQKFFYLYGFIEHKVLKRAEKILVFSESEFQRLSKVRQQVVRCYTWFDSKLFKDERSELEQSSQISLAWIGRLESQKNPLLLINIANQLRSVDVKFKIRVFGNGVLEEPFRELVKNNDFGNSIIFEGIANREQIAKNLQKSDLLLMTSVYEGSPTVIVEALACGVPVVCTEESDPDGMITNGVNGYKLGQSEISDFTFFILKSLRIPNSVIESTAKSRSASILVPKLLNESLAAAQ